MKDNFVKLDEEIANFKRYFDDNNRCILSAPYGEGKSVFLNEFVNSQSDEYDFITIYPTNYQICDNKDILEYIKRDILFGLIVLDNNLIDGFDSTKLGILKKSILDTSKDSGCIPDVSVSVFGVGISFSPQIVLNTLSKIWDVCQKYIATKGNPHKEYLISFDNEKGGIYELDSITNLICSIVEYRQSLGRKVALVIEDLDRIDPGQIFRILNVLSAHMTFSNGYDDGYKNKFNVDKILLVCDYHNIEKIYHHMYGLNTDFKGYISKFSAVQQFEYSIRNKIAKHIGCVIKEYVKDSVVANTLAEEIVLNSRAPQNIIKDNIRNIKDRIRFASNQYKLEKVDVEVKKYLPFDGKQEKATFDTLYVAASKHLMAYLSICKAFSLNSKQILKKISEMPRRYEEPDHILELCGLLFIPLLGIPPFVDYDYKYKLGRIGASRGDILSLSDNGEIIDIVKYPYANNGWNILIDDEFLDKVVAFEQYLFE